MSLAASKRGNALHEIKNAFRLAILFIQSGFDGFRGLGLGKPTLAEKAFAVLVGAGNDPFPRGLDTGDEWRR